ncbi:MAG: NAD(P)-dependent oxidoreductase [Candidatus Delongbacteria bacterium]
MARILLNDGLDAAAVQALKDKGHDVDTTHYEGDELNSQLKSADAVVIRSATKLREPNIDAALAGGKLKLIIRGGVGIDNIDHVYARAKGIEVRNTPTASSAAVAELALAHMFAVSRFIAHSNVSMRQGEWNKKQYKGTELGGATLGIIGIGRIGQELGKRAQALGMSVVYTDLPGVVWDQPGARRVELPELLAQSDYLSLHVPFDKAKGALLGAAEFAVMKKGVRLVNCSRGGVVDEAALLDALNSGQVAGAGIDVYAEEPTKNQTLLNHPNVSATPHIGAETKQAQTRIGAEVVAILTERLGG